MEVKAGNYMLEVPEPVAKRTEIFRIGDRVSVLAKSKYAKAEIHHGVIIGFEPFHALPSIRVAYCTAEYGNAQIHIVPINADSEEYEIVGAVEGSRGFDFARAREMLRRKADEKHAEAHKAAEDLAFFERYWGSVVEQATADAEQ